MYLPISYIENDKVSTSTGCAEKRVVVLWDLEEACRRDRGKGDVYFHETGFADVGLQPWLRTEDWGIQRFILARASEWPWRRRRRTVYKGYMGCIEQSGGVMFYQGDVLGTVRWETYVARLTTQFLRWYTRYATQSPYCDCNAAHCDSCTFTLNTSTIKVGLDLNLMSNKTTFDTLWRSLLVTCVC